MEKEYKGIYVQYPAGYKPPDKPVTPVVRDREFPCESCETGEYKLVGNTSPAGIQTYECDECGDRVSFP
jgi:hypothetical protein